MHVLPYQKIKGGILLRIRMISRLFFYNFNKDTIIQFKFTVTRQHSLKINSIHLKIDCEPSHGNLPLLRYLHFHACLLDQGVKLCTIGGLACTARFPRKGHNKFLALGKWHWLAERGHEVVKKTCIVPSALQRYYTENSKLIFPEKELRGHSPNSYIHIPTISLHILLQENRSTDPGNGI